MHVTDTTLVAVPGLPLVQPGDDLGALLIHALEEAGLAPAPQDVLVVAQKVVSKCEGCYVELAEVQPSPRARELAAAVHRDPRLVEVILSESSEVIRHRRGLLIVAHRLGPVMANAGVDVSNIEGGDARVLLLPRDPDASARGLRERLERHFSVAMAVIINDSVGRAWRHGTVGIALGAAGLPAVRDLRGRRDLYGRELRVTCTGFADEIAAAASLLMGEADEGLPAVRVRGLRWSEPASAASELVRDPSEDLFR
jgi:coenzyme F420-0:L-glutamate ligase/coenzyme F420-1:gamma-L-glutamate ligase